MLQKKALVSVVISVFNDVEHIEDTILSVLSQHYSNKELVVIDAGSTDGTVEVIKQHEEKIAFFISEPDKGIYDGFNKGIQHCNGDWIKILNSGDLFFDEHSIDRMIEVSHQHQDAVQLIYSPIMGISKNGKYLERDTRRFLRGSLKLFPSFFHPSWFVHRSVYLSLGGYNEAYKISSDYEYYLKLLRANIKSVFCEDLTFVCFREGGASSGFQGVLESFVINKKYQGAIKASYVFLIHASLKIASKMKFFLKYHAKQKILKYV